MESVERTAQAVFSARAAHYVTSAAHADAEVLNRMVALAAPRPEWRVLDVATGTGHTAFAFAPRVRCVAATDLTFAMLREARTLSARVHGQDAHATEVRFFQADVHFVPFADGAFDCVTSRRAPHHFSDIGRALREMRRVVRAGGTLVIDDRSVPEDDFVDTAMNALDTYHDWSHVRQYRPSEWRRMLDEAGFEVTHSELYTKHRPLTSLTKDVCAEDVAAIEAMLGALATREREKLGYETVDGEPHITHWYLMIAAIAR